MAGKGPHRIRQIHTTQQFSKDLSKTIKSGVHDLTLLNAFLGDLVAFKQTELTKVWKDHGLNADPKKGFEDGDRDAHLKGDLALIYRIEDHPSDALVEVVYLMRIGTHSVLHI